jgi:D-alanine-D-alanine ligase
MSNHKRREKVNRRVLIAVLYNEMSESQNSRDSDFQAMPLNFKPCFDLEETDIEEELSHIVNVLQGEGFDTFKQNIRGRFENLIDVLRERRPDVVFNLVESSRDSPLQEMMAAGICEMFGIPYTGATPLTLGICQRKGLTKQVLLANGILTPRFKLITDQKSLFRHMLRYPLIVKPGREDGSTGIENDSVVFNLNELKQRVAYVLDEFHPPVIVEEFIEGRELNVSILGSEELVVLPMSEVDFSEMPESFNNIVTYHAKWEPRTEVYHKTIPVCPAHLTKRVEKHVKEIALKAYKIMGCRDYARIDIRLDRKNNPFVLEVNPNPYLSDGIGFMRSAEAHGLSFGQVLRMIVEFALRRSKNKTPLQKVTMKNRTCLKANRHKGHRWAQ